MEITARDRNAIRSAIERQLEAFQKDDAKGAFTFASQGIKDYFVTAENFMRMVRNSYPVVYRPRSVLFEEVTMVRGNITQPVLLMDANGTPVKALYLMEKQRNGSWKVGGCYLVSVETEIS